MIATSTTDLAPFPGLLPFSPEMADMFFGREEQVEVLLARLQHHRFLAITGSSGSGKSSLVAAGLIPALERGFLGAPGSRWRIVISNPGTDPVARLAGRLAAAFGAPAHQVLTTLGRSSIGLSEAARGYLQPGENLFVLIDQFEEIFRFRSEAGRRGREDSYAFVKLLLTAAGRVEMPGFAPAVSPICVVITMRSDYLGHCSQFPGLPEALSDSQYVVPRMSREQQIEAIEGPAGMAGAQITPRLVQQVVNDVERDDGTDQLPILQHVLLRTWETSAAARSAGLPVDVEHYDATGRVARALNLDADNAFAELKSRRREEIGRRIFQRLVTAGVPVEQTRRPTSLKELAEVASAPPDEVADVIAIFRRRGFLVVHESEERPTDPLIDIPHESLIRLWDRLGSWSEEESRSAQTYLRLAHSAAQQMAAYRNPELRQALDWRQREDPNAAWAQRYTPDDGQSFQRAMAFLDRSRLKQRGIVLLLVSLSTAACVAVGFIVYLYLRAERASNQALARELASKAISASADPMAAVNNAALIAAESHSLNASLDADIVLRRALGVLAQPIASLTHELDEKGAVRAIAFDRSGRYVATGGDDNAVHLFDAATARQLWSFRHGAPVRAIAFSGDGQYLATASDDRTAGVFRITDGGQVGRVPHDKPVRTIAFTPDSKWVATGGNESTVRMFSPANPTVVRTFEQDDDSVAGLAFSLDGTLLGVAGGSGTVSVIDVQGSRPLVRFHHDDQVRTVSFSRDGRYLATASADGTARIFDLSNRRDPMQVPHSGPVNAVAWGGNDGYMVSAGQDGVINLLDVRANARTSVSTRTALRALSVSDDGNTVAAGGDDSVLRVFSLRTGRLQLIAQSELLGPISAIAFGRANTVAVSGRHRIAWVFDITPNIGPLAASAAVAERTGAFGNSGTRVASADADGVVRVFDGSGRPSGPPLTTGSALYALTFSPDARRLAAAGQDRSVRVFDVESGRQDLRVEHDSVVDAVAFGPSGRHLATGTADSTVTLIDSGSGKVLWGRKIANGDQAWTVRFNRNGSLLAVGTFEGTVAFLDLDGRDRFPAARESSGVRALAYSPDGKWLAVGAGSHLQLYDAADGGRRGLPVELTGDVLDIEFSPNGQALAVRTVPARSGPDINVRVFGVPSLEERSRLLGAPSIVAISFNSDGNRLLSAAIAGDGVAIATDVLNPDLLVHDVCGRLPWTFSDDRWNATVGGQSSLRVCSDTRKPTK